MKDTRSRGERLSCYRVFADSRHTCVQADPGDPTFWCEPCVSWAREQQASDHARLDPREAEPVASKAPADGPVMVAVPGHDRPEYESERLGRWIAEGHITAAEAGALALGRERVPVDLRAALELLGRTVPADGQANTSSERVEGGSGRAEGWRPRGWDTAIQWGWDSAMESVARADPSYSTVMEGIARWWQADPTHRRVKVECQGRLVTVGITLLGDSIRMASVKLARPDTAERVHHLLDHAARIAADHHDVEIANWRVKFNDETGEVER